MDTRQFLMDTGVLLDYLSERLPEAGMDFMDEVVDAIPNVSVVTKIEALSLHLPDEHYQLLLDFMADAIVLDLSPNVIKNCIIICKTHKLELPQAMVAATAITYNYTLLTNTPNVYTNIKGLSAANPWELS